MQTPEKKTSWQHKGNGRRLHQRGLILTKSAKEIRPGKTSNIHRASKSGDLTKVKECLLTNVDVDARDENGSSSLMWAASKQHVGVVQALLARGAQAGARNLFGWSALEYSLERRGLAFSPQKAKEVQRMLLGAGAAREDSTVPPAVLGGDGFARLLHSRDFPEEREGFIEDVKYLLGGARQSVQDMKNNSDLLEVGGVAIAGVSSRRLGLYAGQRYEIQRLFLRRKGPWKAGEERVDVPSLPQDESLEELGVGPGAWEMCVELSNQSWMPWGSVEVNVDLAQLRSVRSELQWALSLGAGASAFWLLALPVLLTARFAFIPSASMEPAVRQGDMLVYNRTAERYERGDIVLLTPPASLTVMALERGVPIQKGDLLVKRLVGLPGDMIQVTQGVLSVNNIVEEIKDKPAVEECMRCVQAKYDFGPVVVPEGKVFLLGDNRGASTDSHIFGFVNQTELMGKAFWKIFDGFGALSKSR
eukprot:CAMPEP_0196571088 /NCGR_PEP_ID=MMETSP1081-20130531/1249_1 /TAXON_ID=36882 /ORGANISM="Pyramimonas amylifera, Strain CCMP720" /LENGTH=474 /DNA_ID=CAMNT_0041887859 /DNA_START=317 /DNA_END=1741 /DNA_ORIENTATION=-